MHKIYVVTQNEIVYENLHNLGLINPPIARTEERPRTRTRDAPPREPFLGLAANLLCNMYLSKDEALEAINELSRHNMNQKWYLLESIAFIEVPPTQPILKKWNTEGELT